LLSLLSFLSLITLCNGHELEKKRIHPHISFTSGSIED
jgi:hypothetical protein